MTPRQYLLKPDKEDSRDLLFASRGVELPNEVDLRPKDTIPIFDQGSLGSCTANAICAFKEYIDHAFDNAGAGGYFHNLSRLYLYWHEREIEGTTTYDSGAYIRDGMKVLQKIGCPGESFFPYVESTFTQTPSAEAETNAKLHTITEYHRLDNNSPAQLKESLAAGNPVVMGIEIYESFESAEVGQNGGIVPMPDKVKEQLLGGHAILAMGYKHIGDTEYIICRNSWGPDWGDKGYFYLPMDFIGRYVSDLWTGR